ncbi:MAG: TraC family protein [Thermodesulfobacteriota bacterium]
MGWRNLIFGTDGMTHGDIADMTARIRFSEFFPYRAFDPRTGAFHNLDDSIGFLWECVPLVHADGHVFDILSGLLNTVFPEGTVLQFLLYADPHINFLLDAYRRLKIHSNELSAKTIQNTMDFYRSGNKGLHQLRGTPVRNFRLLVALKLPPAGKEKIDHLDIRDSVQETLKGIYLSPELIGPDVLISTLSRLFNDHPPDHQGYDPDKEIHKQIILSETPIRTRWDRILLGSRHLRCMTVKKMVEQVDELTFNYLAGDIWGVQGDNNQINVPFLFTVNVIFQPLSAKLHAKCNFVLQQQGVGSFAPSLQRKKDEYMWAAGQIEQGVNFVRIMPLLWHFADSEEQSRAAAARVKRIFQSRGFVTQEDRGILKILWLSALPFGLYTHDRAVDYIDRDFICQPKVAARCLPIQADFCGGGAPYNLFVGRKGQLIPFDLFAPVSENYNGLITATSGSGKSFFTNSLCYNYYTAGALIRIVDIGGSYKKLCRIVDGKFIHFSKDSHIRLNPFTHIVDIDESIQAVTAIIAQMIYSSSRQTPGETEITLIRNAALSSFSEYGNAADIDRVYEYLKDPSKTSEALLELECGEDNSCVKDIKSLSAQLAFNLRNFTSMGNLGVWFNGPANLDIAQDDFVVLELEELKPQVELFNVVTLQLLNYVTENLYLSDRSRKRLVIFDEAWQFFSGNGNNGGETSLLARIIVEGYRRARKYGGSFITITQSLLDLAMFGDVGQVILSNSAYKFLLQSADFEKARSKKLIDYPDFVMKLLKSVRSPKPRYSEIFIDSPMGMGIARLLVDPFSYYLFTSSAEDNALIEKLVQSGLSYPEAFEKMLGQEQKEKTFEKEM